MGYFRTMKKLLIGLLYILLILAPTNKKGCLELDIMILGDLSGSTIGKKSFVIDAIKTFANRFELSDNTIRIGAAIFDDKLVILSPLTSDKEYLLSEVDNIWRYYMGGTTRMTSSVLYMKEIFDASDRPTVNKMLIIISDGIPNHRGNAYGAIRQLENSNVNICGIFINTGEGDEGFMMIVSNPACYVSTSYETLADELERLDICL